MSVSASTMSPRFAREQLQLQLTAAIKLANEIAAKLSREDQADSRGASAGGSFKEVEEHSEARTEAEEKELRAELARQSEQIAELKRKINEHVEILCLPLGFLREVSLYFVAGEIRDNVKQPTTQPKPCRWIRIGHISHRWREAVLTSPKVWSNIILSKNTSYALEMLSRSKPALLDIWDGPVFVSNEVRQAAFVNMPRIRRLDVQLGLHLGRGESGDPQFPSEAPALQSLTVRSEPRSSAMSLFKLSVLAIQKQVTALGKSDMPSLQHLSIHGPFCNIPSTSRLFRSTLTTLVLDHVFFDTDKAPIRKVLDLLANLRLLEDLQLKWVVPVSVAEPDKTLSVRSVSLSRLAHLHLAEVPWACLIFLHCLKFPRAATIKLECPNYPFEDYEPMFAALGLHLSDAKGAGSAQAPLLSASFYSDPPQDDSHHRTTRLVCWRTHIPVDKLTHPQQYQALPKPALDISLTFAPEFIVMQSICDYLPLSGLQSLSLLPTVRELDSLPHEELWKEFCATIPRLRQLQLSHWGDHDCLSRALNVGVPNTGSAAGQSNAPSSSGAQVLLPHLEVLSLFRMNVGQTYYMPTLRARKSRGMELQLLSIRECNGFDQKQAESFKTIVKEVSWDGRKKKKWAYDQECSEDEEEELERIFGKALSDIDDDDLEFGPRSHRSRRHRYSEYDDDFTGCYYDDFL